MKEFYKKNNLIINGNFSMPWFASGIGENKDLMKLKVKISDKLFLGCTKIKGKKIIFNKIYFKNKLNGEIEKNNFIKIIKEIEKIEEKVEKFLKENNLNFGLEINIFSEIPRGHGMGFSGVFSSLLSSLLYILSNKIEFSDLYEKDFINTNKFKEIYSLAFEFEKIAKYDNTNGENSFMTFVDTINPTLFFRDKNNYDYLDIFNKENFLYPFDYYIIFSGNSSDTEKIEGYLKKDIEKFNKIGKFLKENILKKLKIKNSHLEEYAKNNFNYELFVSNYKVLNIKLLKQFNLLNTESYNEKNIENFISIINQHRNLISMIEGESDFSFKFLREFYRNSSNNNKIGIVPIYSGKMGGGFLIVTKESVGKKIINKTIDNIQDYYPNSYIEYCSYEDNKKIEGIKLVQDIEKNIFHKSLIGENYKLKTNKKTIIVSNIEEALEKDFDLIFDTIKSKVYLKLKKLTSKEIHSQNILVEVVSKLFDKQGKWVSNKKFNKSSYSETKSLMGSKVVYSFRKLIKKEFNKDIIFDIYGIGGEFEMKIDFGKLKVGIFEQI